ncbi:MAG: metallophosphoesterase [Anaerolineales bacterium]
MHKTIIHLSDIHFRQNWNEDQEVVLDGFFKDLGKQVESLDRSSVYIAFSGDFVLKGGEPVLYEKFLLQFDTKLNELGIPKEQRICVPGNHDISKDVISSDFFNHNAIVAQRLNEKEFNDYVSKPSTNVLLKKFGNYKVFESKFANMGVSTSMSGAGWSIDGDIGVYCLNTALCSSGGIEKDGKKIDDSKKLAIDTRRLQQWNINCKASTKILVMHHPLEWLVEWAEAELKAILHNDFSLCLSGHNHNQNMLHSINTNSSLIECSAPPFLTNKYGDLGYSMIRVDPKDGVIDIIYRQWTKHRSFVSGVNFSNTDNGIVEVKKKSEIVDSHQNKVIRDFLGRHLSKNLDDALRSFSAQPTVWVEPILNKVPEILSMNDPRLKIESHIALSNIISNPKSLIIKALPQFGLTCLAHYFCKEAWCSKEAYWIYLDSNDLKTHSIEKSVQAEMQILGCGIKDVKCIILDSWSNLEKKPILLQKLCALYQNIPIIVMQTIGDTQFLQDTDLNQLNREFETLYLWTLPRSHIRKMVIDYNNARDIGDVDSIITKITIDLDVLNLPRTPLNCLTLLKVSEADFDESPVNRAELINRILFLLFNIDSIPTYKRRPDLKDCEYVLGYFCETMIRNKKYTFTREEFLKQLQSFCKEKIIDLDIEVVFDILHLNNILVGRGELFCFRFTYWIFYFTAQRMRHDENFANFILDDMRYASFPEVIEFYTGIDRHRDDALKILIRDIQSTCDVVNDKCGFPQGLNPYKFAQWTPSKESLEMVQNELSDGVKESRLPDFVKDQYADRTRDQIRPYYQEVQNILQEYSLTTLRHLTIAGARAIRNSDYVDPVIKRNLLQLITQSMEQLAKVIFVLSPILAAKGDATFEGTRILLSETFNDDPEIRFNEILSAVPYNIISWYQNDLFSRKMGPLLIDQLNNEKNTEFIQHGLILLLIIQRPREWKTQVQSYIASVSKNSFYLMDVYRALMSQYLYSYASRQALDDIKYLVKMIIVKHEYGVKEPGVKAINKISDKMLPNRKTE